MRPLHFGRQVDWVRQLGRNEEVHEEPDYWRICPTTRDIQCLNRHLHSEHFSDDRQVLR